MATDLTVYLDDRPGELARLGALLAEAGVNIEGLCAVTSGGGRAEVHVLVNDLPASFEALMGSGIEIVEEREVVVVPLDDRPGALAQVARKLEEAEVNITLSYLATNTRLVIATEDVPAAVAALKD